MAGIAESLANNEVYFGDANLINTELDKYNTSLRSITQGRGRVNVKFAEYAPVPGEMQKKLMDDYKKQEVEH